MKLLPLKVFALMTVLLISGCVNTTAPTDNVSDFSASITSTSGNMKLLSPESNSKVKSPLIIKGEALVFENQLSYQLFDEDGSVLAEGSGYANSPDMGEFGEFEIKIDFPEPKGNSGSLEVFDYSAKDGSKIDVVKIPVTFEK